MFKISSQEILLNIRRQSGTPASLQDRSGAAYTASEALPPIPPMEIGGLFRSSLHGGGSPPIPPMEVGNPVSPQDYSGSTYREPALSRICRGNLPGFAGDRAGRLKPPTPKCRVMRERNANGRNTNRR